ncbi:MAG: reverse transcriptase family protein [Candidatus Thiodiazotropha sp. (ex Dulcina madagascariensis)]|nr:reverse transcriptase family protein [Candidatus Thiodiazotropha sp. (ex Dulcina madagascariensis)]
MLPIDKKPYSKITPIAHVHSLASYLLVPESELIEVSNSVYVLWKPGKILKKKSGEPRPTFDAKPRLKSIHEKILVRLLKQVHYPQYLLGGVSDKFFKRDYKQHALVHAGKKYLIEEDVKDFFPNTSTDVVRSIWKYLFNFSPEVAEILTRLTTLNGSLPQGWKTSGYLANLAFWEREYLLVEKFHKRGIAYSRFMDDISASAKHKLNTKDKTYIVSETYKMLFSSGYTPKRSKHEISSAAKCMKVTGLIVNTKKPTLPQKEKNNIRAAVRECENHAKHDRTSDVYKKKWNSVSGRVGKLKRFHGGSIKTKKLRERLTAIKPK